MRRVALLAALALAVAGCGIPREEQPTTLAPEGVPFDLLAPSTTTTTTTAPTNPGEVSRVEVFFLDGDNLLRPVVREVTGPPTLEDALKELLGGPTQLETDFGLHSNIVEGVTLRSATTRDGLATIDLGGNLGGVSGTSLRAAYAQLVYTATARPSVRKVLFRFDGEQQDVPIADGELTSEPVTRRDYRQFDFQVAVTSTTTTAPPAD